MSKNKLIFNAPFNSLSFGNVSFNILRELYRKNIETIIFPIGNPDFSAYKIDKEFNDWISHSINTRFKKIRREIPTLKLWHINGLMEKLSDHQIGLTFHETDTLTEDETNICNSIDKIFLTSNWSIDTFKSFGVKTELNYVPLGFDEDFTPLPRQVSPEICHWLLCGKIEARKNTALIINTWAKKFGNNRAHQLSLCVSNPFLDASYHNNFFNQALEGQKPFNINFLPRLTTNQEMNSLYNSADIDISSYSNAEGFGLPAFNVTCLGKYSIISNCSAHKDWANADNSILVEPNGMKPCYDGVFFNPGQSFNQGNYFSMTKEGLEDGMTRALAKYKQKNTAGIELGKQLTYKNTVEKMLEKVL
jgi:hypothetical protein